MNELEFLQRMYLYALGAIGTFRIEIKLDPGTFDMSFIKVKTLPFTLNIPATLTYQDFAMSKHTAKVMSLDAEINEDVDAIEANSAAVVVVNLDNTINGTTLDIEPISCNVKALSILDNVGKLNQFINALSVKIKSIAEGLNIRDADISQAITTVTSEDFGLTAVLQNLSAGLDMDLTTYDVQDFTLELINKVFLDLQISSCETQLLALSFALYCNVDIDAINSEAIHYNLSVNDSVSVNIVLQAMKYMTIGEYYDKTIGEIGSSTLSELTIRIR